MIILDNDEYLDAKEVSSILKIAEVTLRVKVRAKEVPLPIKLRTMKFWKKSEIEEYVKNTA
jgi:predicted DNA-binding transcriptional regulator AlpA